MSTDTTTPNPNKKHRTKTKTAPPVMNDITKRQIDSEGEHNSYDSIETDVSEKEKSFITTTLVKTNILFHKLSPSHILAKLGQKKAKMSEGFQIIKRLLSYLTDHKLVMVFAYTTLVTTAMAQTKMPTIASAMIDSVVLQRSAEALNHVALQFLLLAIVYSVSEYFWGHLFNILSSGIRAKLKRQVFRSLVRKEIGFYDQKSLNEVLYYLNNQVDIAQEMCTHRFSSFGRNFIQLVYSAWMLASISYKLTLFLFLIVPINLLLAFGYTKISSNILSKEKDSFVRTNRKVTEAFQNIKIVKAYSTEETEAQEYRALMQKDAKYSKDFSLAWSANVALTGLFSNLTLLSIVFIGMSLVNSGDVTPGTLSGFLIYSMTVSVSFRDASFSYVRIKEAIPLCKELFNLIDTPSPIPYKGGKTLDDFQGKIEFKNVAFSYPTAPDVLVLKKVSLTINPGESVAFVGMSGGGKSTVVSMLLRFYDVAQGEVTFDDINIKDLDLQWVHERIGYVSQEPILFSGSIEENIAYGLENCTEEKILHALKMANAEFVFDKNLFPDGLKSDIGERGGRLSGGQKQRLAIARALARDPKVLIFDEATSNLDTNSEFEVQKAIDNLILESKITIVTIAHRLSTILKCKTIYVIKSGEIIEKGSHDELVNKGGAYKTLVEKQLKALH